MPSLSPMTTSAPDIAAPTSPTTLPRNSISFPSSIETPRSRSSICVAMVSPRPPPLADAAKGPLRPWQRAWEPAWKLQGVNFSQGHTRTHAALQRTPARFRIGSAPMSRPPALRHGDGIAVVAPSSPFDRERFERGVRALQEIGLEPRFGDGIHARQAGYLAGPDARRLDELVRALRDPGARAVILARGGYGLLRIAAAIPGELVVKPVIGYSDATVLHELWWRAGVPSIHGPMCTQLGEDLAALERLRALLAGEDPGPVRWQPRTARAGRAEGPLRGGNLAVLASLCGTPLQPSFR